MAKNESLHKAKIVKQDEFYTQRVDIENELGHYAKHFKDKVVYCNCDDPVTSEFWQFFVRVFKSWGLKRLIATHYETDSKNYSYSLEFPDSTNNDVIDIKNAPMVKQLPCNGDFRSAACIELLKQTDIVVTNPPFSLFREYVGQLMEYDKKFLIIGNKNALTYKEIFPLIKENKIWTGYRGFSGGMWFYASYIGKTEKFVDGNRLINVPSIWFTNLDIPKRHEPLDLRGNYYHGNEDKYPKYDNYDAIEVSKVADIPSDYDGVMGVPITFMDKYCPEQFEIVGMAKRGAGDPTLRTHVYTKEEYANYSDLNAGPALWINGVLKNTYPRILIRKRG